MNDLLSSLFEVVTVSDPVCDAAIRKYGRAMIAVREALGRQGGAMADALDEARAQEEEALFLAGLRTGLTLMAGCVE